jgi:hypothetical protein
MKKYKTEYSNITFYPLSIIIIIFWYNLSDYYFYLHTLLNDIIFFIIVFFNVHKINLKNFYIITGISFIVIVYHVIKMVLDENIIQEDDNNIYYITTRFIIDAPIRFILKDFVDSPFEEIYFFSILDIILIGFIIHYCDNAFHLSKIYLMISIYGTIIGLIINMILFYSVRLSPPMSTIPLLINIISLIGYSAYHKQFLDFMDIEQNENAKGLKEIEEIQEIQDDQTAQIELFKNVNISFNNEKNIEEEKDIIKDKENDKEENEVNDSDEDAKKKHEKLINQFSKKMSTVHKNSYSKNNINSANNINNINRSTIGKDEDSEIEGMKNFIDLIGDMNEKKFRDNSFSPNKYQKVKKNKSIPNILNIKQISSIKMVEMKVFEEEEENIKKEKDNDKEKEKEKTD